MSAGSLHRSRLKNERLHSLIVSVSWRDGATSGAGWRCLVCKSNYYEQTALQEGKS